MHSIFVPRHSSVQPGILYEYCTLYGEFDCNKIRVLYAEKRNWHRCLVTFITLTLLRTYNMLPYMYTHNALIHCQKLLQSERINNGPAGVTSGNFTSAQKLRTITMQKHVRRHIHE